LNHGDNLRSCLSLNSKLCFLSLVDVASIPLYLAVGPSLDVCVHSEATQQWIVDSIIPTRDSKVDPDHLREPWWVRASGQLERGILLKVEDGSSKVVRGKTNITELLLYATMSSTLSAELSLPTPTPSSPPAGSINASITEVGQTSTAWRIYALPLSSQLISRVIQLESPLVDDSNEARFLGPFAEENANDPKSPSKRKSISSLFEDAAQQSKRLKRRGGEGVSKAMATVDHFPSAYHTLDQLQTSNLTKDSSDPRPARRARLSRASSTVSAQSLEPSRPSSRREPFVNGKRSSMHRVESISSPQEYSCVSAYDCGIEQTNKSALTRIVMAGMRLHGLQQTKRSNKLYGSGEVPIEDLDTQLPSNLPEEDSEYKFVYHQTFKAAAFTFRLHMTTTFITQEAMRDVVDRVLALFCTDPIAADGFGDTTRSSAETSCKTRNPFDLPSASACVADFHPNKSVSSVGENFSDLPMPVH